MTEVGFRSEIDNDGTAWITLNRPGVHNAFDDILIAGLTAELLRLDGDAGVRAVVLRAEGKSFSAGADLGWMRRMADYSYEENVMDAEALAGLMHTLNKLAKPTIAAVQGAAFGGGVGLVACCDVAIATEGAVFSLSEVRLGLIPAVISPFVIAAIGSRQARRYFLGAERFDAQEARRIGLIHEIVKQDQLDATITGYLKVLYQNSPAAVAAAKDLIFAVTGRPIDHDLLEVTAERIAAVRASDEGREGVAAFLEKRRPAWIPVEEKD